MKDYSQQLIAGTTTLHLVMVLSFLKDLSKNTSHLILKTALTKGRMKGWQLRFKGLPLQISMNSLKVLKNQTDGAKYQINFKLSK
jgi:hypothetical protein